MGIKLTFKVDQTTNGNTVKVATISGTLKRLSEKVFSYSNASGEEFNYKLADIAFTDNAGAKHNTSQVVVYEASYEQGMEVGGTYLGRIQRGVNKDGSIRKPWTTLSSYEAGSALSEADFEDEEILDEVSINV